MRVKLRLYCLLVPPLRRLKASCWVNQAVFRRLKTVGSQPASAGLSFSARGFEPLAPKNTPNNRLNRVSINQALTPYTQSRRFLSLLLADR